MSAGVNVSITLPEGTMTTNEVWHREHIHHFGESASGTNWQWCERCQCFVSSKCDHRTWLCRRSKR